jgi:sulfotransferase family protein
MTETRPVFVLCAARTGSTLLRLLLDTHPDLASPPETHVARVCESLERTWKSVSPNGLTAKLPEARLREIARIAAQPLDWYAAEFGKKRWCDKSLDNITLVSLLAELYPEAQFVILVRHCLDFAVSGLDASRWGFAGYGFERYMRNSPGNTVHALVSYWCDYTERLLRARTELGERATFVRYEDLVRQPDQVMAGVFDFLELPPIERLATTAFHVAHDIGPGDHKVTFTDGVHTSSVGTGRRVPIHLVNHELLPRMNRVLAGAGYAGVDRNWNAGTDATAGADSVVAGQAVWGPDAPELPGCGHAVARGATVLLEDLDVCWTVDLATNEVAHCDRICAADGQLITDAATLRELVSGQANIGAALRAGALRARGGAALVAGIVEVLRAVRP